MPLKDLEAFVELEFPFLYSLHVYFFVNMLNKKNNSEFDYDYVDHVNSQLRKASTTFNSSRKLKAIVTDVLSNSPEFDLFLRDVSSILDACLAKLHIKVSLGDSIINKPTSYYPSYTLKEGTKKNNKKEVLSSKQVLHLFFAQMRSLSLFHTSIDNSIENDDGGFVEVKTLKFKNVKIEDLAKDIDRVETRALSFARELHPGARLLQHSGEMIVRDGGTTGDAEYTGSFHVWFTLPHSPTDSHKHFLERHAAFAVNLQWIEPLLLSLTSCDPRAIGAGEEYPRANMRGQSNQNYLSGIATTSSCIDLVPQKKVNFRFKYYGSESDLKASSNELFHDGTVDPVSIYISYDGETFSEYLMAKRVERCNNYSYRSRDIVAPFVNRSEYNDINRRLHDLHAKFEMSRCADIRSPGTSGPKLKAGFRACIIKNLTHPKRFEFRFCDKAGNVSIKAPLAEASRQLLQGIEFRLLDNIPTANVIQVVKLMTLVAAAASREETLCVAPLSKAYFVNFVASVLIHGRYARVPDAYVHEIQQRFGLPPPLTKGLDAFDFLNHLASKLFATYATTEIPTLLNKTLPEPPKFSDHNSDAFAYFLEKMMATDVKLKLNVDEFKTSHAFLKEMGTGWKHDVRYVKDYATAMRIKSNAASTSEGVKFKQSSTHK